MTLTMETLLVGLKDRRIPKSLDEIKPRRLPPPGKTAMQMIVEQWPGDETDEELQAALKARAKGSVKALPFEAN